MYSCQIRYIAIDIIDIERIYDVILYSRVGGGTKKLLKINLQDNKNIVSAVAELMFSHPGNTYIDEKKSKISLSMHI